MKQKTTLEEYEPTDRRPFTGLRDIDPPIAVTMRDFDDSFFSPTSLLGESKESFLENFRDWGITYGKVYYTNMIEGYGDMADIVIIKNDFGKEASYMSLVFRTA